MGAARSTSSTTSRRPYEYSWPKPAGHRAVVPAQPDDHVRRPRLLPAGRRLRPGEGGRGRPRQRLRRAGLRRLPAAVDPPGRGGQGVRRRAVLDDQVVLDGRLAGGVPGRQRRGRAGAGQAQELPRLRHVPADPDRRDRHAQRGRPTTPREVQPDLPGPPRRALRRPQPHRLGDRAAEGDDVRLGADPRALPRAGLGRVRLVPGERGARSPPRRASASVPAATATCASPSSRTSSASARPSATSGGPSPSWAEPPACSAGRGGRCAGAVSRWRRRDGVRAEVPAAPRTPWRQTATPASMPASSRMQRATRRLRDAEHGLGDEHRVDVGGSGPRRSPRAIVGGGVVDGDLLAPAQLRRRSRPRWPRTGTGGTSRGARPTTPCEARMPRSMRSTGSSTSAMASLLAPAEVASGPPEDLEEQLLLGVEVPVEDALADAEALDDLGHRGRVVAVVGERAGRRRP